MNKIRDIDSSLIDQNENSLCYTLLFGKENMNDDSESVHILNATIDRSSRPELFCKKGVLTKHLRQSLFFDKVVGLQLYQKRVS